MRGVGSARGAVTIVNALPTGIGAALGFDLTVRAEVCLVRADRGGEGIRVDPASSNSPLVREAVAVALSAFLPGRTSSVEVRIDSQVPPSKGLKSSSAVASAIVAAVAQATGERPVPTEVARLSAATGRRSGTSATGAFDDALAGLETGVVVTDNRDDRLLARFDVPPDTDVVVWLPPGEHPPSPSLRAAFAARAETGRTVVDRVSNGDWPGAMERNSALVEELLGYPYAALRNACRERGAIASGVSGLGPAFASLAARSRATSIEAFLSGREGSVIRRPVHRTIASEPSEVA